jgi:hypothetical protein
MTRNVFWMLIARRRHKKGKRIQGTISVAPKKAYKKWALAPEGSFCLKF